MKKLLTIFLTMVPLCTYAITGITGIMPFDPTAARKTYVDEELGILESKLAVVMLRDGSNASDTVTFNKLSVEELNISSKALLDIIRREIADYNESTPTSTKRWGILIDKANSDPDTRVAYLYDAVGKTPASMTYDPVTGVGTFNYGGWEDFATAINRPVMLNPDGTVAYGLDRGDQTLQNDGVTESEIATSTHDLNAMAEFKLLWKREYADERYIYIVFAEGQINSYYHAHPFVNNDGEIQDHLYIAMYESSHDGTRARSLADQSIRVSRTAYEMIAEAGANGDGWHIESWQQRMHVVHLCWLISKSTADQLKFGTGNSNSGTIYNPGETKATGQFYGANDEREFVKVFYVENLWGNVFKRTTGIKLSKDTSTLWAKPTRPYTYADDSSATGYVNTGLTSAHMTAAAWGNTSTVGSTEQGMIPYDAAGTDSQWFTAGLYSRTSTISVGEFCFAQCGGHRGGAGQCGGVTLGLLGHGSDSGTTGGSALTFLAE